MKKVLVMYARYGTGHKSMAEFISSYLKEHNNYEVELFDITPYSNFVGKIGIKIFDYVTKHRTSKIFGLGYHLSDNKLVGLGHNYFTIKSYDNEKLKNIIKKINPDITISTHFYASDIIVYYNDLKIINSKIYTVITDYRSHEMWIKNYNKEDGFIVASDIVKEELINKGIPSKKIFPFGLPINLTTLQNLESEEEIIKRYRLEKNMKTYLFYGGSSSGSMYYFDYFKVICNLSLNKNIIFVCGNNEKLKRKCDEYIVLKKIKNVKVIGYTKDGFNLMKVSSLVISKPGGATVTECIEMRRPMFLIPGLGGQEKYNLKYVIRKKYGISASSLWSFKRKIKKLERNFNVIDNMKKNLFKLDSNKSVVKINELIKKVG